MRAATEVGRGARGDGVVTRAMSETVASVMDERVCCSLLITAHKPSLRATRPNPPFLLSLVIHPGSGDAIFVSPDHMAVPL